MLALIAGTVSYLHMHLLVALHGQPGWVAALTPLSVDGMIAAAAASPRQRPKRSGHSRAAEPARRQDAAASPKSARTGKRPAGSDLQRHAWEWAVANRAPDGSLPSGRAIAARFGRHERWGRLVKQHSEVGRAFDDADSPAA
jgi:hypothetical protein